MRFLLIGQPPVTPAAGEAVVRHGHSVVLPEAVGLGASSTPKEILEAAQKGQLDIVTADAGLAEAPYELDYWFGRSLVFLQLSGGDVEQDDAIDRLFTRYKRLTPKRMYTVTEGRVKVRQLPGR